ncbi:hypothetical protein [Litoribacillus peritrichatus]|uniref:Uncharacterized protein n=1 Tax=Litoribacillus peritrichatus TaxID=718191 RepID=A0ABP7M8Z2_9GAMM
MREVLIFGDGQLDRGALKCHYTETGWKPEWADLSYFIYECSFEYFLDKVGEYLDERLTEERKDYGTGEPDFSEGVTPLLAELDFPNLEQLITDFPSVASSYIRSWFFNDTISYLMPSDEKPKGEYLVYQLEDIVFCKSKVYVYGMARK